MEVEVEVEVKVEVEVEHDDAGEVGDLLAGEAGRVGAGQSHADHLGPVRALKPLRARDERLRDMPLNDLTRCPPPRRVGRLEQ